MDIHMHIILDSDAMLIIMLHAVSRVNRKEVYYVHTYIRPVAADTGLSGAIRCLTQHA